MAKKQPAAAAAGALGAGGSAAAARRAAVPARAAGGHQRDKDELAREMIERVADKWTMLVLDALEPGVQRFTRIRELVGDVSQKMLTKTLRQLERDGLVTRTVYPVVPPHVEYKLTRLGLSLAESFCGVWKWADAHATKVVEARRRFDVRKRPALPRAG